jgi:hypothetical protein
MVGFVHSSGLCSSGLTEALNGRAGWVGCKVVSFAVGTAWFQMGAGFPCCFTLFAMVRRGEMKSTAEFASGIILASLPVVAKVETAGTLV